MICEDHHSEMVALKNNKALFLCNFYDKTAKAHSVLSPIFLCFLVVLICSGAEHCVSTACLCADGWLSDTD